MEDTKQYSLHRIYRELYNNTMSYDIPYSKYLFEIIDNRTHTNSKKVFININSKDKKCIIGYENPIKEKNKFQQFLVKGRIENEHFRNDNISSRGMGLHYHNSFLRSNVRYLSHISDSKVYELTSNYNNIF